MTEQAIETQTGQDRFRNRYKDGTISQTTLDTFPDSVKSRLKGLSSVLIKSFDPDLFSEFYIVEQNTGDKTYVARLNKDQKFLGFFPKAGDYTFVIDTFGDGQVLGYAKMRKPIDRREKKEIPVTDSTVTFFDFRKKGLATRRYRLMNALSRMFYDEPLQSKTYPFTMKDGADLRERHIWEGLVKNNEVLEILGAINTRYVFK